MASFTSADDTVVLDIPDRGETIDIALSGTYSMLIDLEREIGSNGSGAWQKVKTVSAAANATIASTHVSENYNERIRLRVITDTSGTCVATLTDNDDRNVHRFTDQVGNVLLELYQTGAKFFGSVQNDAAIVATTAALTLNANDHAGKTVVLSSTTGRAITLPLATGTGNVYKLFIATTVSSGSHTLVCAGSDTFSGGVGLSTDIGGVTIIANAADDTVTMNGTTTGGLVGSWLQVTDVAAAKWMIEGFLCSSGNEADPFS